MKTLYRSMNEQILPPGDMKARVFAKIEKEKKRKPLYMRPLGAAAAILAAVLLATPVMAAYGPAIEELMYQIAPHVASRFSPVQESDENNGIRMEVVAASVHGNTVELYLGFTDLEGKGRIDLDTYPDMVMFTREGYLAGVRGTSGSGITEPMRYDPEKDIYYSMTSWTCKAYSQRKGRYLTIREIYGEKLTATVDNLYRYVEKGEITLPVSLQNQETMTIVRTEGGSLTTEDAPDVKFLGFGLGSNRGQYWMQEESYEVMKPGEAIENVTEDFAVTGVMYLDGMLHLQVCQQAPSGETVTPVYDLSFEDAQGNRLTHDGSVSFDVEEDGKRLEYTEYLYRLPEEDLEDHRLVCSLSEYQKIQGPWQVTFPLVESDWEE